MQEKTPVTKRKTSSNSKKTPAKKRAPSKTKAKKPKVALAKTRVALLSALISGICVLALALSVILNQGTEVKTAESEKIAKVTESPVKKEIQNQPQSETYEKKAQLQKEKSVKTTQLSSQPKAQVQAQSQPKQPQPQARQEKIEEIEEKKAAPAPKKPEQSVKSENVAKNMQNQQSQNKKSEPKKVQDNATNVAIVKKDSVPASAIKTIPQSQTSKAGNTQILKSVPAAKNSAKTVTESTHSTANAQKTASQATSQIASNKTPRENETIQQNIPKNRFDIPPASNGATVVIIIDDAGRSAENTRRYTSLPFPITIAVLPKLPETRKCADVIRASGQEMILHQPMQSMNLKLDPGPGKITGEMSSWEIAKIIKENLAELGTGVKGMNNHEGSLVTSNVIKIGAVLDVCDEMGVYFLDSRTTAETKAPQAALERDMKIFEKAGPYLDNEIDRAKMLERMRETLSFANRYGRAIVIGHVDKSVKILPDLLREMYPEMKAAGYRFATPSMLR